jgi:hypothetical protein
VDALRSGGPLRGASLVARRSAHEPFGSQFGGLVKIPLVRGTIERRVLVNYRVQPEVLARLLPPPFRPKLTTSGFGIAGICLIRLRGIRPRFVPMGCGFASENAAHRIAVEWDTADGPREGVYIPRRDSSSRFNALVGGRLFPGVHHLARFDVLESAEHLRIALVSHDGSTTVLVEGSVSDGLPTTSTFASLSEASEYFRRGSLGYSPTNRAGHFDGLELRTFEWHVQPLRISRVASSYFAAPGLFPPGSVSFDCALLMRNLAHEWHAQEELCGDCAGAAA